MALNFAQTVDFIRDMMSFKEKDSILLVSPFGVGKSSCFRKVAQLEGVTLVDQRLSQKDVGDLTGFPFLVKGRTFTAPPGWVPIDDASIVLLRDHFKLKDDEIIYTPKRGILLLDEIDRSSREVQQCGFEIVLDRRLNMNPIQEGWLIGGGINLDTDIYHVNEMDPAFIDRFAFIPFAPTQDEFIDYMRGEGKFNEAVINFLITYPNFIDPTTDIIKNNPGKKLYSRRSWQKFSRYLNNYEGLRSTKQDKVDLLEGSEVSSALLGAYSEIYLGSTVGGAFRNYVASHYKSINADTILNKWSPTVRETLKQLIDEKKSVEFGSIGKLILHYITDKQIKEFSGVQASNLTEFMCELPNEGVVGFWKNFNLQHKEMSMKWFNGQYHDRISQRIKESLANPKKEG
jgi:hypothetical protein